MSQQRVIETQTGWMIQCKACQWHEIPKRPTSKGHSWRFNGNLELPSFTPSMNEARNPADGAGFNPEIASSRCHFVVTDGQISYCGDCTHELRGQSMMLEPWPQEKCDYYRQLKDAGWP